MINEMIEKYYILNGSLLPVEEIQKEITGGSKSIYEVIRVISGVPLFLEKHMDRLEASANLIGYSLEKKQTVNRKRI
jgi:branched-chain amino acid aminotransferase